MSEALMIFVRNPELGKVRTRLAATTGQEKALEIYQGLLAHTLTSITFKLPVISSLKPAAAAGRLSTCITWKTFLLIR